MNIPHRRRSVKRYGDSGLWIKGYGQSAESIEQSVGQMETLGDSLRLIETELGETGIGSVGEREMGRIFNFKFDC
jgi:hypothetical protein